MGKACLEAAREKEMWEFGMGEGQQRVGEMEVGEKEANYQLWHPLNGAAEKRLIL